MVASVNGTTYNGLARACSPVSRLPAVPSGCPTTAFMDCSQVSKQPGTCCDHISSTDFQVDVQAQQLLSLTHSGFALGPNVGWFRTILNMSWKGPVPLVMLFPKFLSPQDRHGTPRGLPPPEWHHLSLILFPLRMH